MPGAFSKITTATTSGGGTPIRDGIYKFLVERAFMNNGHNGECFIAELRVLESSSNGATDDLGKPVIPNPAGSQASLVCNITKYDAAAGTAKKFITAALEGLGYTLETLGDRIAQAQGRQKGSAEDAIAYVCSESNPLHGVMVHDQTYQSLNKGRYNTANAGKKMTNHNFGHIQQDEAAVQAQRKYLAENKPKVDTAAQAQLAAAVATAVAPQQSTEPFRPTVQPARQPAAGSPLGGILFGGK